MRFPILTIILILNVVIPLGFAEKNETITKQDLINLENKLSSLESKYNYSFQEIKDGLDELKSDLENNNREMKDEVNRVTSLIDSLDQKLSSLDENLQAAFSITWGISNIQLGVSIISGASIALITMVTGHVINDVRTKKRVKEFLQHDFTDVNERIVILISNLRNTLQEIGPNSTIVDSLINHEMTSRIFMRRFLTGLLFFRWDAAVANMNSLKSEEVEIISKLRGFIIRTDELPQLDISLVSETINSILNSNDSEGKKRQTISDALRIDLTTRIQHYDRVYHTMREDLTEIKWINLPEEHFR